MIISLKALSETKYTKEFDLKYVAGTRYSIFRKIFREFGLRLYMFSDPCPFNEHWNGNGYFDALTSNWFGQLIWLNCAFGKYYTFIKKITNNVFLESPFLQLIPHHHSEQHFSKTI